MLNFRFRINHKKSVQDNRFSKIIQDKLLSGPEENSLVVYRATPSSNKLTRWVIVYRNVNGHFKDEYFKLKYTIQDFEIPVVMNSSFLSQFDKVNKKTWYVRNEEEMYKVLQRIDISPGNFTLPEGCNYPFV